MKSRSAFTLVEVLVVISILVILAAILFMAASPQRALARRTSCGFQMKQLYIALYQYAQDNDEDTTYPELNGLTYVDLNRIKSIVKPYGVSDSQFYCPSSPATFHRLYTTYGFSIDSTRNLDGDKRKAAVEAWRKDRRAKYGDEVPLIFCPVHDEFEVQGTDGPNWRAKPPFLLWIDRYGALKSGRNPSVVRIRYSDFIH